MTQEEKLQFKHILRDRCVALIRQRITNSAAAIESAQEAANAEEKSSAGDKYETGRAMNHMEKEMHSKQLVAHQKELSTIQAIECNAIDHAVKAGSVVQSKESCFFILAGLGRMEVNGNIILLLSPFAPVARLLMNKTIGDIVLFNKKAIAITDIF